MTDPAPIRTLEESGLTHLAAKAIALAFCRRRSPRDATWMLACVQHVSTILEQASKCATRKEKKERGDRYVMKAYIATHLPGGAARKEARFAEGPMLRLIAGWRAYA